MSRNILEEAKPYLFEKPIPGQSLVNSPNQKYAWESPPEITSQKEAIQRMFLDMIKPDNMETLVTMMSNDVPIANIAELLVKTSFQKGKINPDLAITMMEPLMFMLKSLAEKVGIDPILSDDDEVDEVDDPNPEANLELAEKARLNRNLAEPVNKLRELQNRTANIPLATPELREQLKTLDTSKVKASIEQKNTNPSLLSKEGE
tara:strand:+ start:1390 stop:2001 length:612 start_codon:yes stop_codon:yes gene_type:complete